MLHIPCLKEKCLQDQALVSFSGSSEIGLPISNADKLVVSYLLSSPTQFPFRAVAPSYVVVLFMVSVS